MVIEMRITQNHITRQYLKNSNTSLSNWNDITQKISSRKQFEVASENPVNAARSMQIRSAYNDIETQLDNLDIAKGLFNAAETSLRNVVDISHTVATRLVDASENVYTKEDFEVFSNEIKNWGDSVLAQLNTEFRERNVFGGSNNEKPPFAYDKSTGEVTFNGVDVNSLNREDFPQTQPLFCDIGIGMTFDEQGNVDSQTALDLSLPGVDYVGFGVDEDGFSKNIAGLFFQAAEATKLGDVDKMSMCLQKIREAETTMLVGITEIGSKQQTVETAINKLSDDKISLTEAYVTSAGFSTEALTEQITMQKAAEMAYNATLSMGGQIIPPSIFDYIK